jgi:hypothetical protein
MQRYVRSGNLLDIEPVGIGAMRVPCLSRRTTHTVRRWAERGAAVSKRINSPCKSGRSRDWIKVKDPDVPTVKRLEERDWGR